MKDALQELEPLQRLLVAYAKPVDRDRYALLFALDARFAEIIRSTSEILIGQMRLTWWRDILTKPETDRPTGEPLVEQINILEQAGASLDPFLKLLDGWEVLLDDFPWSDRQFDNYAQARGEGCFQLAIGRDDPLDPAQAGMSRAWALWDFARHCSDDAMRKSAFARCAAIIDGMPPARFDRSGRPLAILSRLVARDVKKGQLAVNLYSPATALRIMWHGLSGR